jgi:hypothetical protein
MALRTGHGTGAGVPRIEVLPADELPVGVPAPHAPALAERTSERTADGRWAPGARTAQRSGGLATRGKTRLADRLGLSTLPSGCDFAPYRASAVSFRRAQTAQLARDVGGGLCGPAPSSLIATASRLGDASRQSLLAAHELCAREAAARPKAPVDPLAAYRLPPETKP